MAVIWLPCIGRWAIFYNVEAGEVFWAASDCWLGGLVIHISSMAHY